MTEFRVEFPEEKYLSVKVSPRFYRENELSGFVAVFHDITQIEKLEQVRKDFIANVPHEIKTPVTTIKGFADTLLDSALEDKENAARFSPWMADTDRKQRRKGDQNRDYDPGKRQSVVRRTMRQVICITLSKTLIKHLTS